MRKNNFGGSGNLKCVKQTDRNRLGIARRKEYGTFDFSVMHRRGAEVAEKIQGANRLERIRCELSVCADRSLAETLETHRSQNIAWRAWEENLLGYGEAQDLP
jgi:hypothetical protein